MSAPHAAPEFDPGSRPERPFRVAVLQGAVREGRRGDAVSGWAAARLSTEPRFVPDLTDPRAPDLSLRRDRMAPEAMAGLRARLADAARLFDGERRFVPDAEAEAALDRGLDDLARRAAPLRAAQEGACPRRDAA